MTQDAATGAHALAVFDWFVREYVPSLLELAKLEEHADTLRRLPKSTSTSGTRILATTADVRAEAKEKLPQLDRGVWEAVRTTMPNAEITPSLTIGIEDDIESVTLGMWELARDAATLAVASGKATAAQLRERENQLEQQFKNQFPAATNRKLPPPRTEAAVRPCLHCGVGLDGAAGRRVELRQRRFQRPNARAQRIAVGGDRVAQQPGNGRGLVGGEHPRNIEDRLTLIYVRARVDYPKRIPPDPVDKSVEHCRCLGLPPSKCGRIKLNSHCL